MSGSQQRDCRKRALTNPPGKGPGAQDPRFCPTSWSLAGSTSLQQGHGACRASGGAAVVEVGVTVLGVTVVAREADKPMSAR